MHATFNNQCVTNNNTTKKWACEILDSIRSNSKERERSSQLCLYSTCSIHRREVYSVKTVLVDAMRSLTLLSFLVSLTIYISWTREREKREWQRDWEREIKRESDRYLIGRYSIQEIKQTIVYQVLKATCLFDCLEYLLFCLTISSWLIDLTDHIDHDDPLFACWVNCVCHLICLFICRYIHICIDMFNLTCAPSVGSLSFLFFDDRWHNDNNENR